MTNYQGNELNDEMWAETFDKIAKSHLAFVEIWTNHKNYEMALRCSIIAETYASVASQMRRARNCRIETEDFS